MAENYAAMMSQEDPVASLPAQLASAATPADLALPQDAPMMQLGPAGPAAPIPLAQGLAGGIPQRPRLSFDRLTYGAPPPPAPSGGPTIAPISINVDPAAARAAVARANGGGAPMPRQADPLEKLRMQNKTLQMQRSENMENAAREASDAGIDARALGAAQMEQYEKSAVAHEEAAQKLAAVQAEKQEAWNEAATRINQRQQELDEAANDKSTYWSQMPSGDKIVATIALALGGIGSAIAGGPNQAMGIIQGHIEDWRQKQMMRVQLAEKRLAAERVDRSERISFLQNKMADINLQAAHYYDAAAERTKGMVAQGASQQQAANAAQLSRKLSDESLAFQQAAIQGEAQHILQQRQAAAAAEEKKWNRFVKLTELGQAQQKIDQEGGKASGANAELFVPGMGGVARSKESADRAVQYSNAVSQIQANLKKAAELRANMSSFGPAALSDAQKQLQELTADNATQVGVMKQLGALSESDLKLASAIAGGDYASLFGTSGQHLQYTIDRLGQSLQRYAAQEGILPAKMGVRDGRRYVEFIGNEPAPVKKVGGALDAAYQMGAK